MVIPADRDVDASNDDDGGARRHTGQGEERKQQLLEAAADLFSAKGYANTRIIDICERAGVAKGLFYWYFETKDSLYAELIRSMRQRMRRVQADAMDPDANAVERIRQAAVASMIYLSEHPTFFAFASDESVTPALAQLARESTEVYIQDAERLIREAQRSGHALEWLDPALAAVGVSATTRAFSELLRSDDGERDAHEVAAFAAAWVVRALSGM